MQLKVYFPSGGDDYGLERDEFVVRSEADILKAGFAAARTVREWIRRMPLVPSRRDLEFSITAEMVGDAPASAAASDGAAKPKRKRQKKASA